MRFSVIQHDGKLGEMFEVLLTSLDRRSQSIRKAARILSELHIQSPAHPPGRNKVLDAVLRVAEQGYGLRVQVFGTPASAKRLAKRIEEENLQVIFVVDHSVPVHPPYGLMFGPNFPTANDLYDKSLIGGFWRQKHGVSVVYSVGGQIPTPSEYFEGPAPFHADRTKIFGVFHRKAVGYAHDRPLKWPDSAYSAREFKQKWRRKAGDFNVIYFFCHAKGERLQIGTSGESLDDDLCPEDLSESINSCENVDFPGGLIFLNGCETAVFSGSGHWLSATRSCGFSGFIGTEAIIPTRFAWPFGNDLLQYLLSEEKSLLEALKVLWDRHWPMSLLYSLYCVADVNVRPAMVADYLQRVQLANYSDLPFTNVTFGEEQYSTLPFTQ
jgi:hypothetical protein